MKAIQLKALLEAKTEEIRAIIDANMKNMGDTENDCQRMCLLNRLSDFERNVNGIEPADLI